MFREAATAGNTHARAKKKIGTVGGARLDLLHSPGERCYPSISGKSCRVGT